MKNKKAVLITGGAGYIGSACALSLYKEGHEVVCFDNLSTGKSGLLPESIPLVIGDVTDEADLRSVCSKYKFDTIVHCAAKKSVRESEEYPSLYFATNVSGTLNVLKVMEEYKIPQLLFSSTAAVYDPSYSASPYVEISPLRPQSVYGETKQMAEKMIEAYARLDRLKLFTIFRYFNVAGDCGLKYEDKHAENIFPRLAKAVKNRSTFTIFGEDYETRDGTGVRDYIHLNDLVGAHLLALSSTESGIYNLGTGQGYSVREIVSEFTELSGASFEVKIAPRRAGDVATTIANPAKAVTILGWQPKATLREMVESTLAAYQS